MRLRGKTALVLGAGSSGPGWGNGKAAAVLFAREGARVACADVNPIAAEETRAIIAGEGGEGFALACDVTREADVAAAVAAVLLRWDGRLDVLHNNVGATDMGELHELDLDRWRRSLDLNLTGAFLACKHAIPAMLAQDPLPGAPSGAARGAIVNVSSLAGDRVNAYPYYGYYAAKAGLNHLTRAVAVHYAARGIRANAVMPGVMDTPLIHAQIAGQYADKEEMMRRRHAMSPIGRMGDAWDVARAALFLASDEAAYVTGAILPVDGGLSCVAR